MRTQDDRLVVVRGPAQIFLEGRGLIWLICCGTYSVLNRFDEKKMGAVQRLY